MSSPHQVRVSDARPQPWRNGGGVTRELLLWPDAQAWQVRVSVADIAADGPFSSFEGVDRGFAVLEGAGVILGLPGKEQTVTSHSEPVLFNGELAPSCRLLCGPTRDLNLMVRRGSGVLHLSRAQPGQAWGHNLLWRALFCWDEARLQTQTESDLNVLDLPAGTLCWSSPTSTDRAPWQLLSGLQVFWLGLEAA